MKRKNKFDPEPTDIKIAIVANLVSDHLIIELAKRLRKHEHKVEVVDRPLCAELTLAMLIHKLLGPAGRIDAHIEHLRDIDADMKAMGGLPQ